MGRLVEKTLAGIRILGFSLAGEETVVAAPEYNVCFDVGRAPREIIPIDNLCLSHGHMDHAAGLAYYLSQRGFIGNSPGRVILPKPLAEPVERLMEVWADIEGHLSPAEIIGVEPLADVPIRRDLTIRTFETNHGTPSLGYTIIEERHKLKPELAGKTGPQLVALKKDGVQIEDRVEHSMLTFTGDTARGRFLDLSFVQKSAAVVLECTFFEEEHRVRARAGRHIHVDDLPSVLEAIPDAQVMLIHLTRRTDFRFIKRSLKRVLKTADLERVSLLMERPPRNNNRPANPARTSDPS